MVVRGTPAAMDEPRTRPCSAVTPVDALAPLTPREREVALLLSQGKSIRQVAKALVIAENTGVHVEHILRKLGLCSRT